MEDVLVCISDFDDLDLNNWYINGFEFKRMTLAAPEQYLVYDGTNTQVAFVRLRGGYLRADAPDCYMETIYQHKFFSKWMCCFKNDRQRVKYLSKIAKILAKRKNA